MEEEDDREEWLAGAAASVAVVAHEMICLGCPWKRVSWRKLVRSEGGGATDLEILQDEMGVLQRELTLPPPGWGVRRRRTRSPVESTICELEEDWAAKNCARASPATPLDYSAGSGATVSGGEEGSSGAVRAAAAVMRKSEASSKVGTGEGSPAVFRIPASAKPIRRPGKKKTIAELQFLEKSYLEERRLLHEELESRRRARDVLAEENGKLKKRKLLLSSNLAVSTVGTLQFKQQTEVRERQGRDFIVPLPDLNEPLPEDIN